MPGPELDIHPTQWRQFRDWHATHLIEHCPELEHLLDLPPGSRFIFAPGHEDVWNDPSLLPGGQHTTSTKHVAGRRASGSSRPRGGPLAQPPIELGRDDALVVHPGRLV